MLVNKDGAGGDSIVMQRMKEDYNSSKWFRGDRMLAAPSLSRTYLSEQLALNFTGDQRNRWLQLSTSDRSPSVVPPDPDPERPPSLEERRERLVDNRARSVGPVL